MALKRFRARLTGAGLGMGRRWVDGAAANTDIPVEGIRPTSQVVFCFEWDSATATVDNDYSSQVSVGNGVIQLPEATTGNSIDIMFVG